MISSLMLEKNSLIDSQRNGRDVQDGGVAFSTMLCFNSVDGVTMPVNLVSRFNFGNRNNRLVKSQMWVCLRIQLLRLANAAPRERGAVQVDCPVFELQ